MTSHWTFVLSDVLNDGRLRQSAQELDANWLGSRRWVERGSSKTIANVQQLEATLRSVKNPLGLLEVLQNFINYPLTTPRD